MARISTLTGSCKLRILSTSPSPASYEGQIQAVDPARGRVLWSTGTKMSIGSDLLVEGGTVYLGDSHDLVALE